MTNEYANIYSSSLKTSVNQTTIDSFIACNVGERHKQQELTPTVGAV